MSLNHLPPATQKLWIRLKDDPLLNGFSLVGGTAIALRIGHRISEDIDLAFSNGLTLPRPVINRLLATMQDEGFSIEQRRDLNAEMDFENSGMDIMDYHQDFIIDGTKFTLFAPDRELRSVLHDSMARNHDASGVFVPDLDALFASKCLVSSHRNKSRDWVDLYVLMNDHGYTAQDMIDAFRKYEPGALSSAMARLTAAKPSINDEGYHLLMDSPPDIEAIRSFFVAINTSIEVAAIKGSSRNYPVDGVAQAKKKITADDLVREFSPASKTRAAPDLPESNTPDPMG